MNPAEAKALFPLAGTETFAMSSTKATKEQSVQWQTSSGQTHSVHIETQVPTYLAR